MKIKSSLKDLGELVHFSGELKKYGPGGEYLLWDTIEFKFQVQF